MPVVGGRALPWPVVWLTVIAGLAGLVVSVTGVLLAGSVDPTTVTTIRGEVVELYGDGLYRYDTLFTAANNMGTDLVTLLLGLPLLGISLRWALGGSLRGRLLLLGSLGYLLYVASGYALGAVAYNELFLVYVWMFSASLFAFTMTFVSFGPVVERLGNDLPRRGPGVFMWVSGLVTLVIWLMDPIGSLMGGGPPRGLDAHTTLFTYALDIGVIVPAAVAAGIMILKGRAFGYVAAFSLLVLETLLLPIIALGTSFQIGLGISFTPAEVIGPISGFSVLALGAVWVIAAVLRRVPRSSSPQE